MGRGNWEVEGNAFGILRGELEQSSADIYTSVTPLHRRGEGGEVKSPRLQTARLHHRKSDLAKHRIRRREYNCQLQPIFAMESRIGNENQFMNMSLHFSSLDGIGSDGHISLDGVWINGREYTGTVYGEYINLNGDNISWTCEINRGFKSGMSREEYDNGSTYKEGFYIEGKRTGKWNKYYSDGNIHEISHFDDEFEPSEVHCFYKNGEVQEIIIRQDSENVSRQEWYKKNETEYAFFNYYVRTYYPNGSIRKQGLRTRSLRQQGIWEYYYVNGKLKAIGEYIDGKWSGRWRWFNMAASLEFEGLYEDGVCVSISDKSGIESSDIMPLECTNGIEESGSIELDITRSHYDEEVRYNYRIPIDRKCNRINGIVFNLHNSQIIWWKCRFKDGLKDGLFEEYYENGNPKSTTTYSNGLRDGRDTHYSKDGFANSLTFFVKGITHGPFDRYFSNGNPAHFQRYTEGVKVGIEVIFDIKGAVSEINCDTGIIIKFNKAGIPTRIESISGEIILISDECKIIYREYIDINNDVIKLKYSEGNNLPIKTTIRKFDFDNGKKEIHTINESGITIRKEVFDGVLIGGVLINTWRWEEYSVNGDKVSEGFDDFLF